MTALVDAGDLKLVESYTWYAAKGKKTHYARTGKTKSHPPVAMHQVILGEYVIQIDHRNGNGLDNRRCNLRRCTGTQNLGNTTSHRGSRSRFKGVGWSNVSSKWRAYIHHQGKTRWLGLFESEEMAAAAYDEAARLTFGEFARLNLPKEGEQCAVNKEDR